MLVTFKVHIRVCMAIGAFELAKSHFVRRSLTGDVSRVN